MTWKNAGNTVYVAPRVHIGHVEVLMTWVGKDDLRPIHQKMDEYIAFGKPAKAFGGRYNMDVRDKPEEPTP
jgi:hypothetical protein